MSVPSSRETMLQKIRKALSISTPLPFPQSEGTQSVYPAPEKELELLFAEQFISLQGKFAFCLDADDLSKQLTKLFTEQQWTKIFCKEPALRQLLAVGVVGNLYTDSLVDCDASITSCERLVARTGSIVLSADNQSGRTASVYAPVHICIAFTRQLVYDIEDALQIIKDNYQRRMPSVISFATGPSRTADIEKTLVTGVHGPGEVYVFLVDSTD